MAEPLRVVFDVNVLFSWVGWRGTAYQCVERARQPDIVSVSCSTLLFTLAEKLEQKLGFSDEQIMHVIVELLGFTEMATTGTTIPAVSGNREDDTVLACAMAGRARLLVSGDKRHLLKLHRYYDIEIISPSAFLERVGRSTRR